MPKLTEDEVNIQFQLHENQLSVVINTPRLTIRSTTRDDIEAYVNLFADPDVMSTYYPSGKPFTDRTAIENNILELHIKGWEQNDPFNGFTILDKKSGEFIGHTGLVRCHQGNGVIELIYIAHKKFWQQGIGSEASSALVNHYALALRKRHYRLDGHELHKVFAKARIDNTFSKKGMESIGFNFTRYEATIGEVPYMAFFQYEI